MKQKLFTFFLALVTGTIAFAHDAEIGNIYYLLDSDTKTATVTYRGNRYDSYSNEYYGTVVIPSSVTYYGITYSVTSIGKYAFYNCSSLTSVTIGESVTSIGDDAFSGCRELTSVTISESVTSIGEWAFSGCWELTSVTISESVTSIGDDAFYGCSSLTSVTIGESVTSIGDDAFAICSSLTSVTIKSDAIVNKRYYTYSNLSHIFGSQVTEYVIGDNVKGIGKYAFSGCSSLTSVTIGESVTSIGDDAFSGCSSLTSVTIGESVTSIGTSAFNQCTSLTSVTIKSDAIVNKQYSTYSNLSHIFGSQVTEYVIGDNVIGIGDDAFSGCSSLTSVTIGESVTSIGDDAFWGCSSLTSVTIGESVTSIGDDAFYGCSSLTSVTIPNNVTSIGDWTFHSCSSLTSVTIGESVTSIGTSAFNQCTSLTSVTIKSDAIVNKQYSLSSNLSHIFGSRVTKYIIGDNVIGIGSGAFSGCSSLTSVTIGESVTSIGYSAFNGCSSLTSITIPNSVTSIGKYAFYNCSSLTSVTIGESVTSIGYSAFNGCSSLTSITIPNSVTSIGEYAFYGCSSLTSITCEAATPPTIGDTYTFDGVSESIPVYVPCGCVGAYKAASGWSDFTNIQEPLAEYSLTVDVNDAIMGSAKVDKNTICDAAHISATPNFGYHFVQWNDGNTENPRTLVLTQDTILIAEFAQSFSGQCGDSLYWEFADSTLHITASGKMYDYNSYDNFVPWRLLVTSIKFVTIGESVTSIGEYAFYGCSSLTSVTIGESVTSIENQAFDQCTSLTSVTIKSDAIVNKQYSLSSSLSHIFGSQVTEYVIGDNVIGIGENAFSNCTSLTSVTIGESVTSIGHYAFRGCSSLTSVTIPESVTSIEAGAFYDCSSLTSITIPNSVTSIGYGAFNGCSSLTSVTIGESVTSIGSSAFEDCSSLTSVTIPNSVTSIRNNAFDGCYSLTSITCEAENPPTVGSNAFYNVSKSIPVYVPCGCVGAYKAASGWSDFTNIQEPLAEYSLTVDVNDAIMGSAKVDKNTICDAAHISATPNFGYHFVQWSDGNTDAIRTIELTQDTILTAEFAQSFSGQCGDSLYWELVNTTLHIIGKGEMYDYKSNTAPWKLLVGSIKVLTIAEDVTKLSLSFGSCSVLESIVWNAKNCADASSLETAPFYAIRSQITSFTFGENVEHIPAYLCAGMDELTSMTIPNSVTSIGSSAFYNCSSLTSITIPNSVTSIVSSAFSGCSSLTSVTIPNSVTSIGSSAFSGCSSLTSITIPNSVTSIGNSAFNGCSSLTSVTIGESVTSIGSSAFSGCSSLTSITIPNSVTSIGNSAFNGCSSLTSVTIGESVTSIGSSAFGGCWKLTSVTIPNSVTSIGSNAFWYCYSLTSITCEAENPPTVGSNAFYNVSQSIPVYVPCGCVGVYKAASGWSDFTNIQEPLAEYSIEVYVNDNIMGTAKVNYNTFCEGAQISATPNIGYHFVQWSDGNTDAIRTIELTQDTILTAEFAQSFSGQCGDSLYWELVNTTLHIIGKGEMYDYKSNTAPWKLLVGSIKVLTIAEDVTKLSLSFGSCSVLESIVWNAKNCADASSLETAPFYAIRSQITSFTFGENVEHIPAYLCAGMDELTSMTIPNSVTSIGSSAFEGCASLTSITIPNSVTSIGSSAFDGCLKLTSVTIPNSVTSIGSSAFSGCSSLTSVTIPESVTSIGKSAFEGCSSLTSITIPNSVTSIGSSAFYGCDNITSVTWNAKNCNTYNFGSQVTSFEFGNEVEVVPSSLCKGMEKLTSVTIPESVTSIGSSAFEGCASLTSVTIPESVTSIGNSAFSGCYKLTSVTIPNSVTSIGSSAFYNCSSLTSITIPNSVTSIGDEAFYGCDNITSVTWNAKNCNTYNFGSQVTSFEFGNEVEVVPSSLCKGMEKLTSVTIPNSVKTIGTSAFEGCVRLGKISLGTGLEEIAANAFAGCTRLYDIYVHATYPPFAEGSSFANYNVYVYVPCEYLRDYTLDIVWGRFKFIECIDSEDATTDGNVTVVPGYNDVTITWPTAENADTYSLVINKDNQPFCTLTFNQEGQLLNIAFAPSRDGNNRPAQYAEQAVNGYRFTVTGLTEATQYAYNITTKDAANKTIATYSGEFTTMGDTTTDMDNIQSPMTNCQKILRNGQLLIIRDGVEYTVMGQEL